MYIYWYITYNGINVVVIILQWLPLYVFFHLFIFKKNHYASVSQADWCNMTFTAGNLFPSHSCIVCPDINLSLYDLIVKSVRKYTYIWPCKIIQMKKYNLFTWVWPKSQFPVCIIEYLLYICVWLSLYQDI